MANAIDILINGRNDASAALTQARVQTQALTSALTTVSPAAAQALAPLQSVARAGSAFGPIGVAIGVTTVAMGGLAVAAVKAAADLADTAEQLGRITSRTGIGIETLQVYRRIMEESGGNAESLTTALTFLSRAIGRNDPQLAALGITTKDTGEAFRQLIGILAQATDEAARNEVAFGLMGRGSGQVIDSARQLATEFEAMRDALEKSGGLITEKMVPSLAALDSEMDTLGRNWKGFWQGLQTVAVPAATVIVGAINQIIASLQSPALVGGLPSFKGFGGGQSGGRGGGGGFGVDADRKLREAALASAEAMKKQKEAIEQERKNREELNRLLEAAARGVPVGTELRKTPVAVPGVGPVTSAPEADQRLDAQREIVEGWRRTIEEVTDAAAQMDEALNAVFSGLESGFNQAFQNILAGSATFASTMKTIFREMVSALLAQLARLLAFKVIGFLIGGPATLAIPPGVSPPISPIGELPVTGAGVGRAGAPGVGRGAAPTFNVTINALEPSSFVDFMQSPYGPGRIALQWIAASAIR